MTERIVSTPGTCGGRPRIAGTRLRVQDVYFWHEVQGKSADEIVTAHPYISMADVYAALSFFWANREAILADLTEQKAEYEELKRNTPSPLAEKLKTLGPTDVANDPLSPG